MKKTRKLLTVLFASAMALTMGGIAWAAPSDMSGEDGVIGEFTSADTPIVQDGAVYIYKEITAFNPDAKTVNAPEYTYSYTIAPGTAGALVKDAGGASLHTSTQAVEVQAKAGLSGATIAGSVDGTNFTSGALNLTNSVQLTTAADGAKNAFKLKADFSSVTWTGAGVYRYVITESVANAKTTAGIHDGTISDTRYLDVYVKDDGNGGYEVYGYVCFQNLGDIDGTNSSSVTTAAKTEGFVADQGGSAGTTALTADQYYTTNVAVSKTLENDQAMNSHPFPFTIDFTNASVTANILPKVETSGNATPATVTAAAVSSLDTTATIAHNATVTYVGIPVGITAGSQVDVFERNDVTGTTYRSSYQIDGAAAAGAKNISWIATGDANKSNIATVGALTADQADASSHTIAFTNALEIISPTGLVLRYGPFAAMLVAGIALLFVATRRQGRKQQ